MAAPAMRFASIEATPVASSQASAPSVAAAMATAVVAALKALVRMRPARAAPALAKAVTRVVARLVAQARADVGSLTLRDSYLAKVPRWGGGRKGGFASEGAGRRVPRVGQPAPARHGGVRALVVGLREPLGARRP